MQLSGALLGWCSVVMALVMPLVAQPADRPVSWKIHRLPTAHVDRYVQVLWRAASHGPALYRVVVIPGSGCAGMGPVAQRYFEGLQTGEIWIFHKPFSRPWVSTPPDQCESDFVQYDSLARWQADALVALESLLQQPSPLPMLLLGISEGAEILPALAAKSGSALMGLVLLSAAGLDPAQTFQLQLQKMGREEVWTELQALVRSTWPDDHVVHGRSLRYWRDLWSWSLAEPLRVSRATVLQVWGDADELMPLSAYLAFSQPGQDRAMVLCSWRWPSANHALRTNKGVQVQQKLWPLLDRWARNGQLDCPFTTSK